MAGLQVGSVGLVLGSGLQVAMRVAGLTPGMRVAVEVCTMSTGAALVQLRNAECFMCLDTIQLVSVSAAGMFSLAIGAASDAFSYAVTSFL